MLLWHYYDYKNFISQKKRFVEADVLLHYVKHKEGKTYDVLKLKTLNGLSFYTTSKKHFENLRERRVKLLFFPSSVRFVDYLTTPYIPSVILRVVHEKSTRMRLATLLDSQHDSPEMRELFDALFLALPVSQSLRRKITQLGVNHLLALSGFHMGLLWVVLYWMLKLFYVPMQKRFFPWRNALLDVGGVTISILGAYLFFTDTPASLLRAYVMLVIGWMALLWGVRLLSFSFLIFCIVLIVSLFPSLVLSIGFWLSVSGVWMIYLFLKWSEGWPKWAVFAGMNLWVYLAMLPLVHAIFDTFALSQLLSVPLTLIFTLFYPLSLLFHAAGFGGVADVWILKLMSWPNGEMVAHVATPLWFLAIFVVLSLLAARFRFALYFQIVCIVGWFLFLIENVA